MNEKYDLIAVMNSGVAYACKHMSYREDSDVRFLAFFPVVISSIQYRKSLVDEQYRSRYSWKIEKAHHKFRTFQQNKQRYLDQVREDINAINDEQISVFRKKAIFPHTIETALKTMAENKWVNYLNTLESSINQYPDVAFEDFIMNPQRRLSGSADPSRIALIYDDYVGEGTTLVHIIYDMFRLGYTDIRFFSEGSSLSSSSFKGNLEVYKREYEGRDDQIECVGRDIIKDYM